MTWGAFEAIAAVLGFPIAELEVEATPAMGDETVDNSGTGGGGCIHGEEKATGAEKREQMHESSWWRMSRLPVTATGPQSAALLAENVPTFRQLDDDSHHHEEEGGLGGGGEAVEKGKEEAASANAAAGAAAAAGGEGSVALVALVCDGARQAVGVNAHFAHAYAPGPTWRAAGEQARLLPAFQLAALIVPGDYEEYFDALADVLFGPAFHATALLKALDGRLKPHLALLRVSLLPFPEVGRMAEVVSLRRAPASKHLREQAGLRPGSVLAVAAAAVGSGAAAAVAPCGAGAGKQQQPPPQNGQPRRRVGKKGGPQQQQPPPPPPMPQVLAMISPPSPPPPPLLSPSPPPLPPIPQEPHAAGPGKTNAGGDATAAAGEPPASSLPPQSMEPAGEQARVKGPLQQLLQRSTAPPLLPPQGLTPPPQLSPPSPQQPFAGPLIAAATNAGLPVAAAEAVAVVAISGPRGVAGVRHTHHDTSPLSAALGGMTHPSAPAPADAGHPQQSGPSRAAAAPSGQQQEPQHDGSGPAAAAGSTAPWIQKI